MEEPDSPPADAIMADSVKVNGTVTPLTLSADGKLFWMEGGRRCLMVEKEVLGLAMEGSSIRIKAAIDSDGPVCCIGLAGRGGEKLVRRDFVFEPLSDESLSLWCQKLQDYMDSFSNVLASVEFFSQFC